MCQYQEEHGHTCVSWNVADYNSLYKWCVDQRDSIRYHSVLSVMTPKRFISLCSINFIWDVESSENWYNKYDQLMKYKKRNHGLLPRNCNDQSSYNWIYWYSGCDRGVQRPGIYLDSLSYNQLEDLIKLLKGDNNYKKSIENVQAALKKFT